MALASDATGYENIDLFANIHDWPRDRTTEYVRDIEEFTELGEYLSLPTRVYSAGMQARLAFALATMQSPDILLIDEGIGAGDAEFQEKARARVDKFVSQAKTRQDKTRQDHPGRIAFRGALQSLVHQIIVVVERRGGLLRRY